jgi:hypothetical protein
MKADPHGVLTGTHFIDGDHACCEGALAAGARFAAGYPITPSTEVVERFASRVPTIGGCFIHMEEKLADSVPPSFRELNIKAFDKGFEYGVTQLATAPPRPELEALQLPRSRGLHL